MKPQRFVAAGDVHGDMQDSASVEALFDFIKAYKPTIRICLGDVFDFRHLRKGATEGEQLEAIEADFEAGMKFLRDFNPTVFLWGNHDQRIRRTFLDISKNAALRHLCGQWIDTIETYTKKAKHYPYNKRTGLHRLGDVTFMHGYSHGENAVRKAALTYGSMVMGHIHTDFKVPVEGVPARRGYSSGCLCDLDMPYADAAIRALQWKHGWIYGEVHRGVTTVIQAEKLGDRWIVPVM